MPPLLHHHNGGWLVKVMRFWLQSFVLVALVYPGQHEYTQLQFSMGLERAAMTIPAPLLSYGFADAAVTSAGVGNVNTLKTPALNEVGSDVNQKVLNCSGRGVRDLLATTIYRCNCEDGWTGFYCQTEVKPDDVMCREALKKGCPYGCHCNGECLAYGDTASCRCFSQTDSFDCADANGNVSRSAVNGTDVRRSQQSGSRTVARDESKDVSANADGGRRRLEAAGKRSSESSTMEQLPESVVVQYTSEGEIVKWPKHVLQYCEALPDSVTHLTLNTLRGPRVIQIERSILSQYDADAEMLTGAMKSASWEWSRHCNIAFERIPTMDGGGMDVDACVPRRLGADVSTGTDTDGHHPDFILSRKTMLENMRPWKFNNNLLERFWREGHMKQMSALLVMVRKNAKQGDSYVNIVQMDAHGKAFGPNSPPQARNLVINDEVIAHPDAQYMYLRNLLVHEIGHILGFSHNHPAGHGAICSRQDDNSSQQLSAKFDNRTVLAYPFCGGTQSWHSIDFRLSESDIAGCQALYGKPSADVMRASKQESYGPDTQSASSNAQWDQLSQVEYRCRIARKGDFVWSVLYARENHARESRHVGIMCQRADGLDIPASRGAIVSIAIDHKTPLVVSRDDHTRRCDVLEPEATTIAREGVHCERALGTFVGHYGRAKPPQCVLCEYPDGMICIHRRRSDFMARRGTHDSIEAFAQVHTYPIKVLSKGMRSIYPRVWLFFGKTATRSELVSPVNTLAGMENLTLSIHERATASHPLTPPEVGKKLAQRTSGEFFSLGQHIQAFPADMDRLVARSNITKLEYRIPRVGNDAFPAELQAATTISTLYVNAIQRSTKLEGVCSMTHVRKLRLQLFDEVTIPSCIGQMKTLRLFGVECDGSRVRFEEGFHFGNRSMLASFSLNNCDVVGMMPTLHLPSLRSLSFDWSNVNMSQIDFRHLPNLKVINVIHNYSPVDFPRDLTTNSEITHVYIRDCNMSMVDDLDMTGMVSLETLDLRENVITQLPESICALGSLTWLHVDRNRLETFPDCFGKDKKWTMLDVSNNNLTSLPQTMVGNCESGVFHCSTAQHNLFRELSSELRCRPSDRKPGYLLKLDELAGNPFIEIPACTLIRTHVNMTDLPIPKLEYLIDGYPFSVYPELPTPLPTTQFRLCLNTTEATATGYCFTGEYSFDKEQQLQQGTLNMPTTSQKWRQLVFRRRCASGSDMRAHAQTSNKLSAHTTEIIEVYGVSQLNVTSLLHNATTRSSPNCPMLAVVNATGNAIQSVGVIGQYEGAYIVRTRLGNKNQSSVSPNGEDAEPPSDASRQSFNVVGRPVRAHKWLRDMYYDQTRVTVLQELLSVRCGLGVQVCFGEAASQPLADPEVVLMTTPMRW
eukprot:GFYU01019759.1.p1 GENE.GFYU01019759.1~~GFYU01019759.1.p1  ORF type:complete len:1372 (-),score=140.88 GFYU01019759.1:91-4206(-)